MIMPPQLAVELTTAVRQRSAVTQLRPNHSRAVATLWHSLHAFAKRLVAGDQPRISLRGCDRWHVYDPVTGRRASLESEDEVRKWLERRFYSAERGKGRI